MKLKPIFGAAVVALGMGSGTQAQFMSATEVKPILQMIQDSWLAVRVYDGQDLLYFTNLLAYRCGLEEVLYGINGEIPDKPLPMEPCYEGTAAPAAMDPVTYPPYVAFPVGSVHSVSVMMLYDDGDIQEATFERAQIQIQ